MLRMVALADATRTIERGCISRETPVDDAFATQTRHISDSGENRTVLADGRVGRKGVNAATTFARRRFLSFRGTMLGERKTTHNFQDRERR
jgi:hypothetical protein